jgi:Na+/melibiose symporter-like transporter
MNVVQLYIVPALDGRVSARRLSLGAQLLDLLVWTFVVLSLQWVPPLSGPAGIYFLLVFALSNTGRAVNRVAWPAWVKEYVPESVRSNYFARRTAAVKVVEIAIMAVVVPALSAYTTVTTYHYFLALGVFLKAFCWVLQVTIRTPPVPAAPAPPAVNRLFLPSRWKALFIEGGAFTTVAVVTSIQGALDHFSGAFSHVYLFSVFKADPATAGVFALIGTAATAVSLPFWGRYIGKFGMGKALGVCAILGGLDRVVWAMLDPGDVLWLYLLVAWHGLFGAGYQLALITLRLRLLPHRRKESLLSFELALSSVLLGVAPMLFGLILDWSGGAVAVYRTGFMISAIGSMSAGAFFLLKSGAWDNPAPARGAK